MKEEKHIDQNFRDKLENFSVQPPAHIWAGIQDQLAQNRRRRRIVVLRWISAAAAILLAFLGGWYFSHNSEISQSVTAEKNIVKPNETLPNENVNPQINNVIPDVSNKEKIAVSAKTKQQETEKQNAASVKPDKQVLVASSQSFKRESQTLKLINGREPKFNLKQKSEIQNKKLDSPTELSENDKALIASNASVVRNEKQNGSRWKLGMMVSPGYSSQVANHSQSYASNMTYSANSGNANVTGGISVQMKTGKRWSVESGIYYDQNGQKSQHSLQLFGMFNQQSNSFANADPKYYANEVTVDNGSVVMNSTAGIIAFDKTPSGTEISGSIESDVSGAPQALISSGDFSQVFDFVEIPLYLRYKLIDSRFSLEMLGGLNAAMLVGNKAYIDNQFGLQNIGKTQDISPFNILGTMGIGLNYQLGKHFSLGAEPRFNYFLSSINNNPDVNFRPYRFGFYTGVYYEF